MFAKQYATNIRMCPSLDFQMLDVFYRPSVWLCWPLLIMVKFKSIKCSLKPRQTPWLWHVDSWDKCCNGCSLSCRVKLQTPDRIFPVFSLCWKLSRFHLCFVHCSTRVSECSQWPARACFLEAVVLPTALFSQMTSASLRSLGVTRN